MECSASPRGSGSQPEIDQSKRPPSNLVFLIDVSDHARSQQTSAGAVGAARRSNSSVDDQIAIVVYASASGLVLRSTSCSHKAEILSAIEQLRAGVRPTAGRHPARL
jgi:Ca-activated chloride channel family protein